ncbi:MAG: UDP-N-acetylmuramoyl-tripeptide--D-alanyl-D-alanine ligase [Phycisphaerales bacterium]|nr:MAG: UDP-N-acetylmuramoyl-tripeptide--D-alanyl-D-alanine ligase [Phycisphaerales bacterium]
MSGGDRDSSALLHATDRSAGWHEAAFVARAVGGRWVREAAHAARAVRIDSREVEVGDAFVALRGERTDGHRFLMQVASAGGAFAVVEDGAACGDLDSLPPGFGVLVVDDGAAALGAWARAHRERLRGTAVVAVAGSAGKTTTVRLIDAALRPQRVGTHAPRSFNNHLGVAVTLLAARLEDGYVVCEVGTSEVGETAALAAIVRPDVAVITSLGREHLEGLGSMEGVAREAAAITRGMGERGTLVLPDAEPLLEGVPELREGAWRRVRFGATPAADVRVEAIEQSWDGVGAVIAGRRVQLPMVGAHNAHNAAAAIGVVRALGLDETLAADGLRSAGGAPMRLERVEIGGVRVLHDAYNAHPDSVRGALETLAAIEPAPGGRRVAILGEMLELGGSAPEEHAAIGAWIREHMACDALITLGKLPAMGVAGCGLGGAATALEAESRGRPSDAACVEAGALVRPGDVVLVKASRGIGLERVVRAIGERVGG